MRTVDGLKCNVCSKVCPNRKDIKKHLKEEHGIKSKKRDGDVLQNHYTKIIGEI